MPTAMMAVGPESGGATPYVYWETRNAANALVGGGTYTLQGPRASTSDWGTTYTVTDCVTAPCTGLDQDPDAGEFQVRNSAAIALATSQQWRVKPAVTNPNTWSYNGTTYRFVSTTTWATLAAGAWTAAGTYDFGDFAVRVASNVNAGLTCATGTFYSVSQTGQLYKVTNGVVSTVGTPAAGVSRFNGLGIGAGGTAAYAYERSADDSYITIWYFNGTSWVSTGHVPINVWQDSFIAGAVNLDTGDYYFGGFSSDGYFDLYKYDTALGTSAIVGYINTGQGTSLNGDMAFDASGNLYIVGSDVTTAVYSITAATLASATGGPMAFSNSFSNTLVGLTGVNGMAFNSDGSMYLANLTTVHRYNSSTWTQIGAPVTTGLSNSTDLASCNSPATLTVQKYVVNGRFSTLDQFVLSFRSGVTVSGTATTSGSATGLQAAQVGPLPVIGGSTYTVAETMALGSLGTLANYSTSLVCTDETGAVLTNVSASSGTVTIPNRSGANVVCAFSNAPLTVPVTVSKTVQDAFGGNSAPGSGWTLGMSATRASGVGVVSQTTSATTQQTPASGQVGWTVQFTGLAMTANLAISETQKSDYVVVSLQCTVTHVDGSQETTTVAATSTTVSGVKPGDRVDCRFTNRIKPTYLTLVKKVVGGTGVASAWTLAATGPTTGVTGATGSTAVTSRQVSPGTYVLSESGGPAGYDQTGLACADSGGAAVTVSATSAVTLGLGQNVTCTFTNTAAPASVAVSKVWVISDSSGAQIATYHVPAGVGGAALPAGYVASPTLSPAPAGGGTLVWGTTYGGYTVAQNVTVGETTPVVPAGCQLTSQRVTKVNGTTVSVPLGAGYQTSLVRTTGTTPNTIEITNAVTCTQQLTLIKQVAAVGPLAGEPASSWTLSATSSTPGSIAGPSGSGTAVGAVSAGVGYTLTETGGPATYVPATTWTCTDDAITNPLTNSVAVVAGAVTLAPGQKVTCRITNTTAVLTLLKRVDGGSWAPASNWNIVATPTAGGTALTAPGNAAAVTTGSGVNTWKVKPGTTFNLTETVAASGSNLAYLLDRLEVSTDNGSTWNSVDPQSVSVAAGVHAIYRFVNKPAPGFVLPLTGGMSTDAFRLGGGLLTALAVAMAALAARRRRRTA